MTLRAYLIILLLMSAAAPLRAEDNQEHERKEALEFQIYGDSDGPRNNFDDFIAGLKADARSGLPQPDQSVSQLNFDQRREYKPMNPITIFRW
jgi:hypothetical protein